MDDDFPVPPEVHFAPGERIWHPRRKSGVVVRLRPDGQVAVRFDDSDKVEVLFPWALRRWEPSLEEAMETGTGEEAGHLMVSSALSG